MRIYGPIEQAHSEHSQPAHIPPQQTTAIAGRNDIGPASLNVWHAADLRKLAKARGVEVADFYTQTNLTTVGCRSSCCGTSSKGYEPIFSIRLERQSRPKLAASILSVCSLQGYFTWPSVIQPRVSSFAVVVV